MAKKSIKSKTETKPETMKSDVVKAEIPIWKYFQLKNPDIHKYTRAYKEAEYCGIMKTEGEWEEILKEFMK